MLQRLFTRPVLAPLFTALILCLAASTSQAETETFGEYTVHYIAVNTTFLDPEIAAQYDIVRGSRRGFLNVAILKNNTDGSTTPVTATVSGGKKNLLQQSSQLDFHEVHEGDAIYYLAQFEFSNAETLRFSLAVQPEQQGKARTIEWTTQLYAD